MMTALLKFIIKAVTNFGKKYRWHYISLVSCIHLISESIKIHVVLVGALIIMFANLQTPNSNLRLKENDLEI